MRSVVVVLPASMCAMMPILRILSIGTVRAIFQISIRRRGSSPFTRTTNGELPPIVRERLIRLRHSMYVVFFLDRAAAHIRGVIQFVRQLLRHALFGPRAGIHQNPANRQAGAAVLRNL